MARISWAPIASDNLSGIHEYISKDSRRYARNVIRDIISIVRSIRDFPMAGRIVPEYNREDIRERIYKSYRIVYRLKEGTIEIVRVHHSARFLDIEVCRNIT